MPFPRKLLNETEDIVLDLHPHWYYFMGPLLALVASVVLGIVVLVNDLADGVKVAAGIVVVGCLLWFAHRYANWATTNFVVTTDRVIYRHGMLSKHGVEIPLERINTVFFSQRLLERMLGSGDLVIESAGEKGRQHFRDVRKPSAVQNEIYRQMEANENRKFDRVGIAAAAGTSKGASIAEQIRELDDLRKQGLVSEEEFAVKKQELLDRM